jgi:hypothetical protein
MIPDGVVVIGQSAFRGCASLISITIPASVTALGEGVFAASLTAIDVDARNPAYSSLEGVLFNKDQTALIRYPEGKAGSYTVPDSVTSLGDGSFSGCTGLASVTVPKGVTTIGEWAFSGCTNLASIMIPPSVTSIGAWAFYGCASLADVTIPASVTSSGSNALRGCAGLTTIMVDAGNLFYSSLDGVLFDKNQMSLLRCPEGRTGTYTIPNSVNSIGGVAFAGCTGLTEIYFLGDAPVIFRPFYTGVVPTIYYLPGTTGWREHFDGRPTVLWDPRIQTDDGSFGVQADQFGFNVAASSDLTIVVEASTSLTHPDWAPAGTNTLAGGTSYFSDPEWTSHLTRFYRLRSP